MLAELGVLEPAHAVPDPARQDDRAVRLIETYRQVGTCGDNFPFLRLEEPAATQSPQKPEGRVRGTQVGSPDEQETLRFGADDEGFLAVEAPDFQRLFERGMRELRERAEHDAGGAVAGLNLEGRTGDAPQVLSKLGGHGLGGVRGGRRDDDRQ